MLNPSSKSIDLQKTSPIRRNFRDQIISLLLVYALLLQCLSVFSRVTYAVPPPRVMPPPVTTEKISDAIVSRHKPTLIHGQIDGSLRVLLGESFTINNATAITSDVYLPGTPSIQLNSGAQHGGVINDGGPTAPSNYTVTLANNVVLPGHIHTQAEDIELPSVVASVPSAPGNRTVTITAQSQVESIGDWHTVRDLNVTGSNLVVDLPPGDYGTLTINGNSQVNLSAGTYNFANTFNLDGSATLQATGSVVINVGANLTINSGALTLGSYTTAANVQLNVLGSSLHVKGSSQVSALISAYNADAKFSGTSQVHGRVIADRVTLNGGKVIGAVWPVLSGTAITLFGPRRFDRTTGLPNQYVEQFSLPTGTTSPYVLHIQNGSLDGSNRVSSATIKLNGTDVLLTQNDLNQNVPSLDRTVTLNAQNQLNVSLSSDPGSYLIIYITGTVPSTDTTPPSLAITTPQNNFPTTEHQITVSGTASDAGSGVAHVYVNDVEASYSSVNETWTLANVPLTLGANQIVVRAVDQGGNQSTATINVTRQAPENHSPTVDAGADQSLTLPASALLDGNATDDGFPEGSSLSTSWSKTSGPGTVTFGDASQLSTSASFSTHGTYVLRLTATDGALSSFDEVTITVDPQNQPPTVSAGADQTIALPATATVNGTVTDDGLPTGNTVATTWSKVSGPGTVTFADATATETSATFSESGTYVLRLSATDGELSSQSEVTITVQPENHAPTVNAGADQTISLPASAQLNGTATDDGWPFGSTLTTTWSMVSGPGTVTFGAANATSTSATFSAPGTYVLRLTGSDGQLSTTDDVTIIVTPPNQAPLVNAGADQIVSLPQATANLNGVVSDDGLPIGSTLAVMWSVVSGPAGVTFGSGNQTATTAQFTVAGDYVLRLSATDGALTSFDDVLVRVTPPNQAPVVNAGADQNVTYPGTASLSGSVNDDALPIGGTLTTNWSQVSGPGTVTFADGTQVATTASFSVPGTYVLRLSANDSSLTGSDDLTVIVIDPRIPPVANFVVPQTTGVAGGFVIAASNANSPDSILDNNTTTNWTTTGQTNQFAKIQFYDQQNVYLDRVRVQSTQGITNVKDFDVLVSATTSDDSSFVTVLSATYINNTLLQEFVFPGGPVRARYIKYVPKNNYAGSGNIATGTFNPVAVGSVDAIVSLPGDTNGARSQSPLLYSNGGVIQSFSYSSGANNANGLLGYINGGWTTTGITNQFAIVQLGGSAPTTIKGVKLAPGQDLGFSGGVKNFEIWVSSTTPDAAAFTQVLSGVVPVSSMAQTYLFPGGPVAARYVKYVPLTNQGGTTNAIDTEVFDVVPASGARVVGVSGEWTGSPNPGEAAFDGDLNSTWYSNVATNAWIKTSLADDATQKLYGVRISPTGTTSFQEGPKDFDIRVSTTTTDDSAFTTVFSGTVGPIINTATTTQEFLLPNAIDAKYVQFFWKNGYQSNRIGVRELEALIIPSRGSVIAGFSSQDEVASNCLDLDPSSGVWSTASGQTTNQWIKLLMPRGELTNINHMALRPAIASNGLYGAPKDFELQVSVTDSNDSSFATVLSGSFANNTQLQDYYFPTTQARYVRLLLKNNYQFTRIGVSNFYVYASDVIGTTSRFFDQSSDADSSIVSWAWDFGDGGTSTARNPLHTYAQPGTYTVTLTVTDDTGLTHTRQTTYRVLDSLRASFTVSPQIAHEGGESVRFTDVSKYLINSGAARQYDFGDGASLSQPSGSSVHTYAENGVYHVNFKIGDPLGTSFTATSDVTVLNVAPSVDIPNGKTVVWGEQWTSVPTISDQSVTDRLTLQGQWNFGDGQTSTCVNCTNANATVTHAYANPGTYIATLSITDRDGSTGSDSATYIVNKRTTSLTFQDNSLQSPGQFHSRAKLTDLFANAGIANRTIQFTINGTNGSAVTDANGVAEIVLPIATNAITASISANFASDSLYLVSSNSASVTLNFAPVANAGADQATTVPCGVNLSGTATDDGVPTGSSLSYTWSKVSGPGNVTFASPNTAQTGASFSAAGKYVLRLAASDSQLTGTDDVVVTVNAVEVGPAMYLGPTPYLSFADSPISGHATTYFYLENFEDHLFNTPGVTASAGGLSSVAFGPGLHDSVDADDGVIDGSGLGGDAYFTANGPAGLTFTFNATVLGHLPTHAGLVWTDGAGQVFFEAFDRNGVSMGVRGPYTFPDGSNNGTTAEDNFLGAYNRDGISAIKVWNTIGGMEIDHLQYSFSTANTPPSINAGPDQTIAVEAGSVALNGVVSDDGLPACVTVTSTWSKVSGPGAVTFGNAQAPATTAAITVPGIYVLRLTASDTQYTNSDDVVIRVTNNGNLPPTADAGADQVLSVPAKSVGTFVNNLAGFNNAAGTPPVVVDFDSIAAGTDITGSTLSGLKFDLGNQSPSAPLIVTRAADTFTPSGFTGVINASTNKLIATSGQNVLSPGGTQLAPGPNALLENDDVKITFAQPVSAVGFDVLYQSLDTISGTTVTILDSNGNVLSTGSLSIPGGGGPASPAGTVFYGYVSTRANIATVLIDESDSDANNPDSNIGFDSFRVGGLIPSTAVVNLTGAGLDDGQPVGSSLSYAWSKVSGPGSVTFANPQAAVTSASFSETGAYTLRLTVNDSQLSGTDDVVITVNQGTINRPPVVNAGPDQSFTLPVNTIDLNAVVTDDGQPVGGVLSYAWTVVSGPGNVLFGNSHATSTSAAFNSPGTYVLRIVASDSQLTASDDLVVVVNPEIVNQPPTVSAGVDQSATINGNLVANPGNEAQLVSGEIPGWTEVQGTTWTRATESSGAGFPPAQRGQAYFNAGAAADAELRQDIDVSAFAGTIAAGTQQFELKVYLRSLEEATPDTGRVIVEYRNATNTAMIATLDSGPINTTTGWHLTEDTRVAPLGTGWIRIRLLATRNSGDTNDVFFDAISLRPIGNAAVKLLGTSSDDGLPTGSTLTNTWSMVSGPAAVAFANANSATTGASFTAPGTYVLRLMSSDGVLSATDDVTVLVNPQNLAPVVNAGDNQTITLPASASLSGTVTDDGQPPGSSVSISWSKVSGPGTVTFTNASAAATSASFSVAGSYVLRLTADDGEYASSADVTITVNPDPGQVNQPPSVNPGPNQTISLPADTATLNGTATDDGLPTGSTLVVTWTKVSGPGTVTFGNANSPVTTAQFSAVGDYVLRLSASDSAYLVSAEVGITLTPQNQAPTVYAGADQVALLSQPAQLNGVASDDGLPSGNFSTTWSKISGPGTVTFDDSRATVTGAHFSATGTYVLRLTATDGALSTSDDITITVNDDVAPPTVQITAPIDDASITEPTTVTGSVSGGDWKLEYSLASSDDQNSRIWTTFATGNGATNGTLGIIDPTMMLNGLFDIRLSSVDEYGQISRIKVSVVLERNLKVGNFTVSFTDLSIPVAGVPMEVTRTYDSRDKRVGDFGFGWTMGLRNIRVEKSSVLGLKWFETVSQEVFPNYCLQAVGSHMVTVTFPGGKVFKFQPNVAPQCQRNAPITAGTITFTPMPGTVGKLEVVGTADVQIDGSVPGPVNLIGFGGGVDIFNSFVFKFTAQDGTAYIIDQRTGLISVADLNGNTITIGAGGITHSNGQSITFIRDDEGRIITVTDPAQHSRHYTYDANGNLDTYTDAEGNISRFTYTADHLLQTIQVTSADGTVTYNPASNSYENGRLKEQVDAFNRTISYNHDIANRRETITDRLGNQTVFEYDAAGNVVYLRNAEGGETHRTFDDNGNVLTETTAQGTNIYEYDADNNLKQVTDAFGNVTKLTYNQLGQVTSTFDARGNLSTITYNESTGNILSVRDTDGNETQYTYGLNGLKNSIKRVDHNDPTHPVITTFDYFDNGYLKTETDALGNVTSYTYDDNGNRKSITAKRTNSAGQLEDINTSFEYDKLNRIVKTVYPDNTFTLVFYTLTGQRSSVKDQLGRETKYDYDALGQLIKVTFPDNRFEEIRYDEEGRRTQAIDRAGRTTLFSYDRVGHLIETLYADGGKVTSKFDLAGRVKEQSQWLDANTKTTTSYTYGVENHNKTVTVTDALNHATKHVYDENGNLSRIIDAGNHTTSFEYDGNNRRIKVIYPDGTLELRVYDGFGRLTARTDQAQKTTQFRYDSMDRVVRVIDALDHQTNFTYDEAGNQITQADANNHVTRFEYDQLGRRTKRILPAGLSESITYDIAGNLKTRADFNGKLTTYDYDSMNRLLEKIPDSSFNEPSVTYTYTATGQRQTMTDASGVTTYAYDDRDRLLSKVTPQGAITYSYDKLGNIKTLRSSNANGASVDYDYDELNRVSRVLDNRLPQGANNATYTYDAVGNLQSYTYPNAAQTAYTYNSLNRLTEVTTALASTMLARYTYELGPAGNRLSVTELNGRKVNYGYDDTYRLTSETVTGSPNPTQNVQINYTYDAVGNRLTRSSSLSTLPNQTLTYDANDRLTSDTYDNNGNTITANGNTYSFDWENHLQSINNGTVAYVYDGDGNRVSKTVGGSVTHYLIDTNNLTGNPQVVDEIVNGAVVRTYTYGHDLISQNQLIGGNWQVSFYGKDGHGSVRYLTNASGVVTDTYDYDASGNLIASTGSTPNERLFAGEQFDANAGFYYLRARYLNPGTGRFWSMDTYGGNQHDPLSLHKYLYASANPVTNIDPSGRSTLADATFTCALVGALAGGLYGGLKAGLKTGWDPRAVVYGTLAGAMIGFIAPYIIVYGGSFIATTFGVPLITGIQVAGGLMFAYATQQQLNALQAAETDEERLTIIIELVVSCGLMAWGVTQMYDPEVTVPPEEGPNQVPGGGLQAHEAAGGHLIGRHVNQSVQALAARLQVDTKIPAASTFTDQLTAETAVTAALDANEQQISTWLNGASKANLRVDYTSSTPVGVTLQRGASAPIPAYKFRVILVKDPSQSLGYYILTGYPE